MSNTQCFGAINNTQPESFSLHICIEMIIQNIIIANFFSVVKRIIYCYFSVKTRCRKHFVKSEWLQKFLISLLTVPFFISLSTSKNEIFFLISCFKQQFFNVVTIGFLHSGTVFFMQMYLVSYIVCYLFVESILVNWSE